MSLGALKRLSIAEEIVHGPPLLLIDEPVTNLDAKDVAIVMNVFREMVNQDKTVIATVHQVLCKIIYNCSFFIVANSTSACFRRISII